MVRSFCYVQFRAFLRHGIICWGRDNEIYAIFNKEKGLLELSLVLVNIHRVDRCLRITMYSRWLLYACLV